MPCRCITGAEAAVFVFAAVAIVATGLGDDVTVAVHFEVSGAPATYWSVHHKFALEVRKSFGSPPGQIWIIVAQDSDIRSCNIDHGESHTDALRGTLASGEAPVVARLYDTSEISLRWEGLQLIRGGSYGACWCPGSSTTDCFLAAFFDVTGPTGLQNGRGLALTTDFAAAGAYRSDVLMLQVFGANLTLSDRVRLIDASMECGKPGARGHSKSVEPGPDEASLPLGVEEDPNNTFGYGLLVWPGVTPNKAGIFRACWCSTRRETDAIPEGDNTTELDSENIIESTDTSASLTTNSSDTTNNTNMTALEDGSMHYHTNTSQTTTTTTTTTITDTAKRPPSKPKPTCATDLTGDLYDVEFGSFAVAGPTRFEVLDTNTGSNEIVVDRNFSITVYGVGLIYDAGHASREVLLSDFSEPEGSRGRIRVLSLDDEQYCGEPDDNETISSNTRYLFGQLSDDPLSAGRGDDVSTMQTWGPNSMVRGGRFVLCWCSGNVESLRDCNAGEAFDLTLGVFSVQFVGLSIGGQLRTVVGVEFDLQILGPVLTIGDRIRIVDGDVTCGGKGSSQHSLALRGPLARAPDAAGNLFQDRSVNGVDADESLIIAQPGILEYKGLRLTTTGLRRVCWCPGAEHSGLLATSRRQVCYFDHDFYTDVGTFVTVQVNAAWVDPCTRARRPFRVHLAALDVRPDVDRILVGRATDVCGEALPRGLSPGGQIAYEFGFAALRCVEDPNAGAEKMERKLVCGDRKRTILVDSPGLYRICLCVALPGYDCSDYTHYTIAAGTPFEIAAQAGALSAENAAAAGGGAQPPLILGGAGGAALAIAYAPAYTGGDLAVVIGNFTAPDTSAQVRLAVGSEDGAVRLWEPSVPRMVAELVGHSARVDTIAWSPDGSWLASSGADGSVRLWGTVAGATPGQEQRHPCPNWESVWWRPGGDATDDVWQDVIFAHLLDLLPGMCLHTQHRSVHLLELPALTECMKIAHSHVSKEYRAYEQDNISAADLKDASSLTLKRATLQCEKVCPAYREEATRFCDCGPTFECHHLHTCRPRCGLEMHVWKPAHYMRITAIGVSPDGAYVMSASVDATVRIWDVAKDVGKKLAEGEVPQAVQILTGHARAVLTLAFPPSAEPVEGMPALATGGADAKVMWYTMYRNWSLPDSPTEPFLFLHELPHAIGLDETVYSVSFSADGRVFAAAGANGGCLWDVGTRLQIKTFQPAPGQATAAMAGVSMAPDGYWAALRFSDSVQLFPLELDKMINMAKDRKLLMEIRANPGDFDLDPNNPPVRRRRIDLGEWVTFDMEDLSKLTLSWSSPSGPSGNNPQYSAVRHPNGTIKHLIVTPCNVSREAASEESCAEVLPIVQLDVEVPFTFNSVRGSFVEFSSGENLRYGENLADDCRGGSPHTSWNDPYPTKKYFTRLAFGFSAESADCVPVGPKINHGSESVEACKQECVAVGVCNVLNYRHNPKNCDLRRCLDATHPTLSINKDKSVYAYILRSEADELLHPTHDGYVMFGAPDTFGVGGIVYGGCGVDPGPSIPKEGYTISLMSDGIGFYFDAFDYDSTDLVEFKLGLLEAFRLNGVLINSIPTYTIFLTRGSKIAYVTSTKSATMDELKRKAYANPIEVLGNPATVVDGNPVMLTRRLRFQIAQSQNTETVGIRDIRLELFRPSAGRRFLAEPSGSSALSWAPSRRELAAAIGTDGVFAVWDLLGFDINSRNLEFKLKAVFDLNLTAADLQFSDRITVVSGTEVPACGDSYSAQSTRAVQGIGDGRPGMVVVTETNSTEVSTTVVYPAGDSAEVAPTLDWLGLVATRPDVYRVCFCRGRAQACCDSDGDFATQLYQFTIAGANPLHYFVCENTPIGPEFPRWCQFNGITGVGLQEGDMVMVQDGAACGLTDKAVEGVPNSGVAISRKFVDDEWGDGRIYEGGTWYRFESQNCKYIAGKYQCFQDPDKIQVPIGLTARLCWCAKLSNCNPNRPSDFIIDVGKVTIVNMQQDKIVLKCIVGVSCVLSLDLTKNHPFRPGDLLVAKGPWEDYSTNVFPPANQGLGRQAYCTGAKNARNIGPANDGLSEVMSVGEGRMGLFDFGRIPVATPGTYRMCWCQGSIRPCISNDEFTFDIGRMQITQETDVWPSCTEKEEAFDGWRFDYHVANPSASTYDECCCNFHRAGAVGCHEPQTDAVCARFPRR